MFVFGLDASWGSEVHFYGLAHNCFAIEDLADSYGRRFVEEGDYDPAEGLEGRPRVDGCRGVDEVFDGLEVVCAEDLDILEVCDEECV